MMKRTFAVGTALLFAISACGGGEPAQEGTGAESSTPEAPAEQEMTEPSGELQMVDWYQYDEASNTVTVDIVAGQTDAANYWNFNGYTNGDVTVVVPAGAEVTINFSNEDGNGMAHSIGVSSITSSPPAAPAPEPVFEGAISSNAADLVNATGVGETETITFTADQAGEYSLLCYVPGHAVGGMWIGFEVSDAGEAGVRGAAM